MGLIGSTVTEDVIDEAKKIFSRDILIELCSWNISAPLFSEERVSWVLLTVDIISMMINLSDSSVLGNIERFACYDFAFT